MFLFDCGSSFGMMSSVGIVGVFSGSFSESLSAISITNLIAPPLLSFFLVMRMPAFDFFVLTFGVAGDGARYLRMVSRLFMNGMPVNWLLSAASMIIWMGVLKMLGACTLADFVCMGAYIRMHLLYVRWIVVYILQCICSMLHKDVLADCVLDLSSDL